jgi:hypothetical protein
VTLLGLVSYCTSGMCCVAELLGGGADHHEGVVVDIADKLLPATRRSGGRKQAVAVAAPTKDRCCFRDRPYIAPVVDLVTS